MKFIISRNQETKARLIKLIKEESIESELLRAEEFIGGHFCYFCSAILVCRMGLP